ncbi:MAG: hypothetical protein WC554_06915 [Clostridia bacterium]|jgi:hypothetical protein
MTWIKVADEKPPMNIPLLVIVQEWGQPGSLAIARAFQSTLPNQPIQWALMENVYHLERPYYIADEVRYWARIEMPDDIKKRELMQISCME